MLNTKLFYDNQKYFTSGYYIWTIFGPVTDGTNDGAAVDTSKFFDGSISFLNLGALSAPVPAGIDNTNAIVYYGSDSDNRINAATPAVSDSSTTSIVYRLPSVSSGVFVNRATSSSSIGVGASSSSSGVQGYAVLYWLSSSAVNGLNIADLTNDNINDAKGTWGYVNSSNEAAGLYTEINDTNSVKTFASLAGSRGTDFEMIYYANTQLQSGTSVLNSYNYTGFTVGNLTITLTANSN